MEQLVVGTQTTHVLYQRTNGEHNEEEAYC